MKPTIFILIILWSYCCIAQQNMSEQTEAKLVEDLQNRDQRVRKASAAEIRLRLASNKIVIKPGNIIEHTRAHWEALTKKYENWTNYDELESALNLPKTNRKPNFGRMKAYYLDHHFMVYVEQHKKKAKARVKYLIYSPMFHKDEPPQNFSGVWKIYDINGMIQSECTYKSGKKHGLDIIFHDNGMACWSKVFKQDSIMEISHFSTNGSLISKEVFDAKSRARWEKEAAYEESMQSAFD